MADSRNHSGPSSRPSLKGEGRAPSRAQPKRGSGKKAATRRKKPKKDTIPTKVKSIGKRFWTTVFSIGMTAVILGLLVLAWFASDLPNLNKLQTFEKSPGIRIYAADGSFLTSYGDVVGEYITYGKIPKNLIAAVLATEDRRYFHHSGIDYWGLARAMFANLRAGGVVQGGSTITQQVAKNVFLTPDRTLKRKLQEVMLAFWLENHFTKQEILEIYLNRVYLGAGNFGVDAASQHYFGKSAKNLNLQESALLAGLLKAPSRYAPTRDSKTSQDRTRQVILNMQDAELLDEKEAAEAISAIPEILKSKSGNAKSSRYFTDWIVDQIPDLIGSIKTDLVVRTTLKPKLQDAAQTALSKVIAEQGGEKHASQASLVAMTTAGEVQALVGGVDYNKSQYNRATQALRQPGSAFKLFVYLAAIEAGYTPDSWVTDAPVQYGTWAPKNYDGKYHGEIQLREAFYRSLNTVSVQLAAHVGPRRVVDMARRLGITATLKPDLSIALGTNEATLMEMTGAYAHLSQLGQSVTPYGITEIRDSKGKELFKHTANTRGFAIRSNVARMMNNLMIGTVEQGTGRRAAIGRPAAGKTGTSQDFRDAWFLGFTAQMVAGVWVGNDDNSAMNKVTGGGIPAQIWHDFMQQAHAGLPVQGIPRQVDYGLEFGPGPGSDSGFSLPWLSETDDLSGVSTGAGSPSDTKSQPPQAGGNGDDVSIFDWFDNGQQPQLAPAQGSAAPVGAPVQSKPQPAMVNDPDDTPAPLETQPLPGQEKPAAAPAPAAPKPAAEESNGPKLEQEFWDKLYDQIPEKGELQHEYPNRRR